MAMSNKMVENTIPILRVRDMDTSLTFYESKLGFTQDWQTLVDNSKLAGISRDDCSIYLCEGNQGSTGAWIWMGVEGGFIEQVAKSGATIVQEPTNYPWAYELRVQDPDGNVIRIGTEPRG